MCPHLQTESSTRLIEGLTVLRCKDCRSLSVEGGDRWIKGGEGWQERLKAIAALREIADTRDEDQRRHEEMLGSPITDPRWERVQ